MISLFRRAAESYKMAINASAAAAFFKSHRNNWLESTAEGIYVTYGTNMSYEQATTDDERDQIVAEKAYSLMEEGVDEFDDGEFEAEDGDDYENSFEEKFENAKVMARDYLELGIGASEVFYIHAAAKLNGSFSLVDAVDDDSWFGMRSVLAIGTRNASGEVMRFKAKVSQVLAGDVDHESVEIVIPSSVSAQQIQPSYP